MSLINKYDKEWVITRDEWDIEKNGVDESIFTVANGYIGFRGDFEEEIEEEFKQYTTSGTYINGFYEIEPIQYAESAYGFAKYSQTMLNLCNPKRIQIEVDGESVNVFTSNVRAFRRTLDMKNGVYTRNIEIELKSGKMLLISITRLVSLSYSDLGIIQYNIKPLNFEGSIKVTTFTDLTSTNKIVADDPRVGSGLIGSSLKTLDCGIEEIGKHAYTTRVRQCTKKSNMSVVCCTSDEFKNCQIINSTSFCNKERVGVVYEVMATSNQTLSLNRYITFYHKEQELENCEEKIMNYKNMGFENILKEQIQYLEQFWKVADIQILGDEELTQGIRFNIFQLLQSVGKDGHTSIAAKGLSGEGYEGHYFWESETYIAPVFMSIKPEIARQMLIYRYNILDNAKNQARLLGHQKGALYAWRSINGDECSAYFPAGSAQYHLSADIAFAIKRYFETTGDVDFLCQYGIEILLETARLWIDVGHFKDNQFRIDGVTGPDEYTAIVNNNCYTNLMAQENLWFAVKAYYMLREKSPQVISQLEKKIHITLEEIKGFKHAADHMYIPFSKELGIHMQDDTFQNKKMIDFTQLKRPMLLHYHPLFIYRHQVCKQADLILAEFLLSERFSIEQKYRDFKYYEKVTTHDSSLSGCIFAIMGCEIGEYSKAYDFLVKTVRTDLDDLHHNTKDGLHMANMAGAWSSIVCGFARMRMTSSGLKFNPCITKELRGYTFSTIYNSNVLKVQVDHHAVTYTLIEGNELEFYHGEHLIKLRQHEVKVYEIR